VSIDFRREGEQWLIANIDGDLPYWMLGPTEARRVEGFWVFYRPALAGELAAIQQETAAALERVRAALPGRVSAINVMFVSESAEEFERLTGRATEHFLGVALSRYLVQDAGIEVAGAAFYINGAAFREDPQQDRQQTITHELVHLALAEQTMPFTPVWVAEGMAMEVSGDLPIETMRTITSTGALAAFDLTAFTAKESFAETQPGGGQIAADYAYSAYLTRYLVSTYGFERFLAFYDSFAEAPLDDIRAELEAAEGSAGNTLGDLAARLTPERLQESFGIDLPTLERDFKAWLPTQF
jgi:hypothetical protein